ncbi:MAG: IclR family transcriptional regulator C-terminal domain-containing protein [Jatrophihabitantaceae bacterium]
MSNFVFLRAEWRELFAEAPRAERNGVADPRACCFYARRCLELAVSWLYDADATLVQPYRDDLSARLLEPTLRVLVGNDMQTKMDLIRRQGNSAVHKTKPVTSSDSLPVLGQLFQVLFWVARNYSRVPTNVPPASLAFDPALVPRPIPAEVRLKRQAELQETERRLAAQDAELTQATGVGKVLLAYAPEDVQQAVLTDLHRVTAYTIIQPRRLQQELLRVRRDGFAQTHEEMSLGACSVAVPVRDHDGLVVAALGIVVASLKRDRPKLVAALEVAAQGIKRSLVTTFAQ